MRLVKIFSVLVLLFSSSVASAQGSPPAPAAVPAVDPGKECAAQVQKFYAMYLKRTQASMNGGKSVSAQDSLKVDQTYYTPELYQALKDDLDASSKVADEIVGLDFDPVLNAQDVPNKVDLGPASVAGEKCQVKVFETWGAKKEAKPSATVELVHTNGQWLIANYHYDPAGIPANENLLSILKTLKADRAKAPAAK